MSVRRIILGLFTAAAIGLNWSANDRARADEKATEDDVPHVACGPTPYVMVPQTAPNGPYLVQPPVDSWVQPAPPVEVVPLVPLPQTAGPPCGPLNGPIFA